MPDWNWHTTRESGIFVVPDYEIYIEIWKFKMMDPRWNTTFLFMKRFVRKTGIGYLCDRWLKKDLIIHNYGSKMVEGNFYVWSDFFETRDVWLPNFRRNMKSQVSDARYRTNTLFIKRIISNSRIRTLGGWLHNSWNWKIQNDRSQTKIFIYDIVYEEYVNHKLKMANHRNLTKISMEWLYSNSRIRCLWNCGLRITANFENSKWLI